MSPKTPSFLSFPGPPITWLNVVVGSRSQRHAFLGRRPTPIDSDGGSSTSTKTTIVSFFIFIFIVSCTLQPPGPLGIRRMREIRVHLGEVLELQEVRRMVRQRLGCEEGHVACDHGYREWSHGVLKWRA
jgi:hypothetical protein